MIHFFIRPGAIAEWKVFCSLFAFVWTEGIASFRLTRMIGASESSSEEVLCFDFEILIDQWGTQFIREGVDDQHSLVT